MVSFVATNEYFPCLFLHRQNKEEKQRQFRPGKIERKVVKLDHSRLTT